MERIEIEARVKILEIEIKEKQDELDKLNKELMDSSDNFRDKFIIWANSGKAEQLSFIADGAARVYCDKHLDLGSMRGCVNFLEYEDFEAYAFSKDGDYFESKEEEDKFVAEIEADEVFMNCCKQMVEENFDSFQIDW